MKYGDIVELSGHSSFTQDIPEFLVDIRVFLGLVVSYSRNPYLE